MKTQSTPAAGFSPPGTDLRVPTQLSAYLQANRSRAKQLLEAQIKADLDYGRTEGEIQVGAASVSPLERRLTAILRGSL